MGILAAIGGLVVMAIVVLIVAYFLLSWRLTNKLRQTVAGMEEILADSALADKYEEFFLPPQHGSVPPMRIHLRRLENSAWDDHALVHRIDQWLLQHSFRRLGDYVCDGLKGELYRVYLSDDQLLVAAIRDAGDDSEPFVEFSFDLGNSLRGGISNPSGLPLPVPSGAVGKYYSQQLSHDFEVLSRMWLDAKDLVDAHDVHAVDPQRITQYFEEAHAAHMDSRIASGGVSEAEIRAAFEAQGSQASREDIEEIQEEWQQAIEAHLLDFSPRGVEQHRAGREILIVHDASVGSYLVNRIQDLYESLLPNDQDRLLPMSTELQQLLQRFSPREAMARFRPLLPNELRYDLVDQIKQPVEADLYALPNAQ